MSPSSHHRRRRRSRRRRSRSSRRRLQSRNATVSRRVRGGAAVAKGAAGCVFRPALACKGSTVRNPNTVSKMGRTNQSNEEYQTTQRVRGIVSTIANNQNYFVVPLEQCTPAPLTQGDLDGVDSACEGQNGPLETPSRQLNARIDSFRIIQMVDGGVAFKEAERTARRNWSLPVVLTAMCDLLEHGIAPMNAAGLLHCDVKHDNVVFDGNKNVRLIDWDHAVFISDIKNDPHKTLQILNGARIWTLLHQPVSYGFFGSAFNNLCNNNKNVDNNNLARQILMEVNRFHEVYETLLSDFCRVNTDTNFFKAQVLNMLTAFRRRNETTQVWEWDRTGYVELLQKNYDVYGWWMLMVNLLRTSNMLFAQADVVRLAVEYERWIALFKHYVYTPFILTVPYNIPSIVKDVKILIGCLGQR